MDAKGRSWTVHNKNRFILEIMRQFAGNAHISFEGDLKALGFVKLPDASTLETPALRRNTSWPPQNFVVLPLEPATIGSIVKAFGGTVPRGVLHIKIEKDGELQFGSYDRWHPECIVFGNSVSQDFIDSLVARGLLKSLAISDAGAKH